MEQKGVKEVFERFLRDHEASNKFLVHWVKISSEKIQFILKQNQEYEQKCQKDVSNIFNIIKNFEDDPLKKKDPPKKEINYANFSLI